MEKIKNISITKLIPIIIVITVVMLTFGFSSFQASLNINSIGAVIRIQKDIRVTGVSLTNTTNGGLSSYEDYNVSNLYSGIKLPNSNSTVSFDVQITNLGNIEMGIYDITGLPENLTYTLNGYTLNDALCDDTNSTLCKLGSVTTLHITIGYATNGYDSSTANNTIPLNVEFKFFSKSATARIGNTYYDTLALAVAAVTTSTPTTIVLLRNTTEELAISSTQNITLDMQGYTLSNLATRPVIENFGTLTMISGNIATNSTQGAINNKNGGTFSISGGSIRATGTRQAIYNDNGTVNISGTAYLSATSTERAPVQNQANGTLNVTGGTIVSSAFYGIDNRGTMTIGVADGVVNTTTPVIQGATYGILSSTNFTFNDGIVKGITAAFNNPARVRIAETGYGIFNGSETIGNQTYLTATLAHNITITFNPNGGSVSERTRVIGQGGAIGTLPVPTRTDYIFDGWFTAATGGTQISSTTTRDNDDEFFAHWTHQSNVVTAEIGSNTYPTLASAIAAVPANGTATTITLVRNTSEALTIASGKNVVLDLQTYTLSNSGNAAVFENSGTLTVTNGTITSSAGYAIINNNNGGRVIVTGGNLIATGTRQAIYNNAGGTVEISGDAYLSSVTTGKPTNSNMERATVQNLVGATMYITGGTIYGQNQQAVSNEGTLTIGTEGGGVSTTTPVIIGGTCAIKSSESYGFYDGIVKGKSSSPLEGTTPTIETNYRTYNSQEDIGGTTYNTVYLVLDN